MPEQPPPVENTTMTATEDTISLSRQPTGEPSTPAPAPEAAPAPGPLPLGQYLKRRRTSQTVYVFDLRASEEYDAGHLPGAYSLPFAHVEPNLHRLPFSGDILFYDGGEGSAKQVATLLEENGFSDFWYVEEGYTALTEALRASPEEVNYLALDPTGRAAKVEQVLNEKIRDFLARDGGGLEVVAIEDNRVTVSYHGACGSCSSSTAGTLRFIQGALTIHLNHEIEVVPVES
jgi:Fe-S cluster biogenesis protein NfuA/rhodanese-related sulfurtransferase